MNWQADRRTVSDAEVVVDEARLIECGPLSALIADGVIRRIAYQGIEVVRGVDCPIRDANWATAVPENVNETIEEGDGAVRFQRRFCVFAGALDALLDVHFQPDGVRFDLELTANRAVETNRAGFTLLHPLKGVAGADLTVLHPDGSQEKVAFPDAVKPSQPAFDIAGLKHTAHGVDVDIRFAGEVFEMEDQRNWTDASFKTYCRPLALPFPYGIAAGDTVRQSIEIRLSGHPALVEQGNVSGSAAAMLPAVAMVSSPDWLAQVEAAVFDALPPVTRLVRLDAASDDLADVAAAIARLGGPVELELVVDDEGDIRKSVDVFAALLAEAGVNVASVAAVPRAFLKSYQPSGPWPAGHGIGDAAQAAAAGFSAARLGVGMLTNFTEFNRHPPPAEQGGFATYSTTAIVHAADDRSVFETLEALPHVHRSAQALAGDRPLRLGLASIGMRSNPYGAAVAANPDLQRIAMAMDDPRQRTVFGAAFAVGAYAAAAACGVERIAPAGIGGPFATGTVQNGRFMAWPIHHVVSALAAQASGQPARVPALPAGVFGVQASAGGKLMGVFANCSLDEAALALPGQTAIVMTGETDVSDPKWLDHAQAVPADAVTLAPASVVFTRGTLADG